MNKQTVSGVLMFLLGLYGASWAAQEHFHAWWSFPTLITGIAMAVGGFVLGISKPNTAS